MPGKDDYIENGELLAFLARLALLPEGERMSVGYVDVISLGGGMFKIAVDPKRARTYVGKAALAEEATAIPPGEGGPDSEGEE